MMISSYIRVRLERNHYGRKLFPMLSEISNTWIISVFSSIIMSLIVYMTGIYITFETVILISVVTVILSFNYSYTLLSPGYTLGFPFLIILLYSKFGLDTSRFPVEGQTGWLILMGMLLIVEALLHYGVRRQHVYPEISPSYRGLWINQLYIRRFMFLPFIVLMPSGTMLSAHEGWFFFPNNISSYQFALFPFFIGMNEVVEQRKEATLAKRKAKLIALLGVIVMGLAIGSYFISWFSWLTVITAILGRLFIQYYVRTNTTKSCYFALKDQLKVLTVIPHSFADLLGVESGDEIICVNNVPVKDIDDFKQALYEEKDTIQIQTYNHITKTSKQIKRSISKKDKRHLGIVFVTKPCSE